MKQEDMTLLRGWKESCITRFSQTVAEIEKMEAETQKEVLLIAIDGKCASGKTTLGRYLLECFDANLIHMDDFFLQSHQRTRERLSEVGGNVDYERFKTEVLLPLMEGKTVQYRRFDCHDMRIHKAKEMPPKRINIIEGSYSQHPYFGEPYDLKVFMEISPKDQILNIRRRNGEDAVTVFEEKWIPKENAYFEKFHIKGNSNIIVQW